MRHVKLPALMTPAERLARVASGASDTARAALTRRSGTIYVPSADGATGTIIGPGAGTDETGTAQGVATWVGDTTPPGRPTGVTATSSGGVVVATWDGTLEGGVPADFAFVRVYASDGSSGERLLGELTGAGSCPAADFDAGSVVEVWAVAYDAARDRTGALARNASDPSDAVEVEVVDKGLDAAEVAEQTQWHFWHDEEGAHVTEGDRPADGEAIVGKNVLLTGDGLQVRDGTKLLARFADGVIDLAPFDSYEGYAEVNLPGNSQIESAVGGGMNVVSFRRMLDVADGGGEIALVLQQGTGENPYTNDLAEVRLVNRPSGANGGGILLGGSHIGIEIYEDDNPPTYWSLSRLADVLNNAPYVTSAANVMSTAQVLAPDGAKCAYAPLTLLERTSTTPVSIGSDGTSFRVARAGLYLVSVKALCFNVAAGDICHASVLMDGQEQPRVNVQQNVNGIWSMLAGSEVVRLLPSQTLRLGYACEQGGGSAMQSGATVGVVYLGA